MSRKYAIKAGRRGRERNPAEWREWGDLCREVREACTVRAPALGYRGPLRKQRGTRP